MNSLDFSTDEYWVCNRQITWFAGKRPPLFPACLIYEPIPLKSWWKFIVCLWQVFSDMICVNTCVIARVVVCILSIAAPTMFCYIFWLHAMLGPWLAHCKSSWSCMNWNMSPKICALRKLLSLMRPPYTCWQGALWSQLRGMKGTWKNYLTCSVLLDVGIMIILRRAEW